MKTNFQNLVELLKTRATDGHVDTKYYFLNDNLLPIEQMNHAELWQKSKIIAGEIQTVAKPKDRVLLIYSPGLELIEAFFGALTAGVIPLLTYPPANKKMVEKLTSIIKDAKPHAILASFEVAKKIRRFRFIKILAKIPLVQCC